MIRKIITPDSPSVTVELPANMVGKTVEVLAFEIDNETNPEKEPRKAFLKRIDELTAASRVDLSGFRFKRDEANNYGE